MIRKNWIGFFLFFVLANFACADLTVHFQSPYRTNSAYTDYSYYVYGGAGGFYSATAANSMTDEGDGWFKYTWNNTVSDFSYHEFNIRACPVGSDQNCNGGPYWTIEGSSTQVSLKMTSLFASETEVWIYTETDGSYSVSVVPPGSKIVWFKSPWGNKALPLMHFGRDSVLMRFAQDDSSTCGYFYGAISPSMYKSNAVKSAYFNRYKTPYMAFPENGTVDLAKALSEYDTIYVDGTQKDALITSKIGTLGSCFDSSKTLHVYSPWRSNSTYRDSALFISVGSNIAGNPTKMSGENEYKFWWHYDFSASVVSSSNWTNNTTWGAVVNFHSSGNQGKQYYTVDSLRPFISSFFSKGVYEAWVYTGTSSNANIEVLYSPLEQKVIRLLSPWTNMSPMVIVEGDSVKMGPFSSDTCGWYQGAFYKHVETWDAIFRQTFGFEYFSSSGVSDSPGYPLNLDSAFALHDTVWISAIPLRIGDVYPGRLGDCPTMKISAMVVDWAGESFADSIDRDFGGIYNGNDYTLAYFKDATGLETSNQKCQGVVTGMVQDTLVNGVPARVDSLLYPWDKCSAAHEIEKWFVPEVIATGSDGTEYTNAVCRDIELTLDEEGFWLADITSVSCMDSVSPGFYPIDDFEFLDSAHTIKNPKNDKYVMHDGCLHNYSYSMKVTAEFQYVKGQYFEFRGDDDVWVYINNKLVVDIGGCHNPEEGAVDLDTLGLIEGETYPFHIFYSERNATGANFKMRTSINLQTQKTFYKEAVKTDDGTIAYNLKQMLVDESLSCDVSSVAHVEIKDAASFFILMGGSLSTEGVELDAGLNFGGILINEYMSGFSIDTAAIVSSRALPAGSYVLYFYLASDKTQSDKATFTVPEYPLPHISFADSLWNTINPDTLNLGTYAFVLYPVYVRISEDIDCSGQDDYCVVSLYPSTLDSLGFYDENSLPLDSIVTDIYGHAKFYVMSNVAVENASFKVSGFSVGNEIEWKNINLEKPPVPIPILAEMYDRNGDGTADSLILKYNDVLTSKVALDYILDTVAYAFGDSVWHNTAPNKSVLKHVKNDSSFVLFADSLIDFRFTGIEGAVYTGTSKSHFTYTDSTGELVAFPITYPIADRIAPVITKAIISPSGSTASLTVYFSESLDSLSIADSTLLAFRVHFDGIEASSKLKVLRRTPFGSNSRITLLFSNANGVLPAVGDSVRFEKEVAKDLSGNVVTKPFWVRIEGEQELRTEKTKVFTYKASEILSRSDTAAFAVYVVSPEKSFADIQKEIGLPGTLVRFDMSELLLEDSLLAKDVELYYENYIFTNLGNFVNSKKGSVSCADDLFDGDCTKSAGYVYLAWNMQSTTGRLASTGAYISKLNIKVRAKNKTITKKSSTSTFGLKRID